MVNQKVNRITVGAFIALILVAGLNPIGVRYTVLELPPFWGGVLRFAPAAFLLFALSLILKLSFPKERSFRGALLYGSLSFGFSYVFLYSGLQHVKPGLASVMLALAPLFTLLFASLHRQERFHWQSLAGTLFAVGGIVLVFRQQLNINVPVLSLIELILGVAFLAEGNIIVKRYPGNHPITTNAIGMAVGTVILMIMSLLWREKRVLPVQTFTWLALGYLILFGSIAAFIFMLYLLKRWSASTVAYQFVLTPFVTIAASNLLTHEQFPPVLLAGAALVLGGVLIGIYRPKHKVEQQLAPLAIAAKPLTHWQSRKKLNGELAEQQEC